MKFTSGRLQQKLETESFVFLTEALKQRHVRQSQYMRVVKGPISIGTHSSMQEGLKVGLVGGEEGHFMDLSTRLACSFLLDYPIKCFDTFCFSVQKKIKGPSYPCPTCGEYFVFINQADHGRNCR